MTAEHGSIDKLPVIDYTSKPRKVIQYAGEPAGIRLIDAQDRIDMTRVRTIERDVIDPNPLFARGKDTDAKLSEWIGKEWLIGADMYPTAPMAVVGMNTVDGAEKGEVVGWMNLYVADSEDRIERLREVGALKPSNPSVLEVSYAKLPDGPSAHMASGLRQVCMEALRTFPQFSHDNGLPVPQLEIIADVFTDNEASIRVLESAAFERKTTEVHGKTQKECFMYVLNWNKLHGIMQEKADASFIPAPQK